MISYFLYISFSVGASLLSFLKLGLFAGWLSIEDFGKYSLAMMSYIYITYIFSMGSNEYLLKMGSRQADLSSKVIAQFRNESLCFGLIGTLLGAIAVTFIVSLFFTDLIEVALLCSSLALTSFVYTVFESYFRVKQRMLTFSGMLLAKSLLVIGFGYCLIESIGFVGAILSELFSFLLVAVLLLVCMKWSDLQASKYSLDKMIAIIRNGYLMALSSLFRNFTLVADRYLVSFFLGVTNLGLYSFVLIVYQGATLVSGIIMNVAGPKVINLYQNGNKLALLSKIRLLIFCILLLSIGCFPVVQFIFEEGVELLFEKYANETVFAMILPVYFASVFAFINFIIDWIFVAASRERFLSLVAIISLVLTCVLSFTAYSLDLPLYDFLVSFFIVKGVALLVLLVNIRKLHLDE